MRMPENITEIPPTKIAVEEKLNVEDYRFFENRGKQSKQQFTELGLRRQLQSASGAEYYKNFSPLKSNEPEIVYFADAGKTYYERMKLIDALELLITPDDPEDQSVKRIEFTWDITAYSKDYIWL